MAKVPEYNPKTREGLIDRAALPAVTAVDATRQGDFGASIASGLDRLGDEAMAVADDADQRRKVAALEKQQQDELTATRLGNAFQTEVHYLVRGENGFLNRTGQAAMDTGSDTIVAMQKSYARTLKAMPAAHRERFAAESAPLMALRVMDIHTHSEQQRHDLQDRQLTIALGARHNQLVTSATPGGRLDQVELDVQVQAMRPAFEEFAAFRNWTPDEAARRWAIMRSAQYRGVVERLIDTGDLQGARTLIHTYRADISPDDTVWLDRIVTVAEGIAHTDRLAETIWGGGEDEMMENAYD